MESVLPGSTVSCKHRCRECQSSIGDRKRTKSGCKRRYVCMKNSSLFDEPNLIHNCPKRLSYHDDDIQVSLSKGLKTSGSSGVKDTKSFTDIVGEVNRSDESFLSY